MSDMNNVKMVQRQIKAFNKAWSRAESSKVLSMEYNDIISDIVGAERLLKVVMLRLELNTSSLYLIIN